MSRPGISCVCPSSTASRTTAHPFRGVLKAAASVRRCVSPSRVLHSGALLGIKKSQSRSPVVISLLLQPPVEAAVGRQCEGCGFLVLYAFLVPQTIRPEPGPARLPPGRGTDVSSSVHPIGAKWCHQKPRDSQEPDLSCLFCCLSACGAEVGETARLSRGCLSSEPFAEPECPGPGSVKQGCAE